MSEFYVQNKQTGRLNPWCKGCYRDWYRARGGYKYRRPATCKQCGTDYTATRSESMFCSRKCKDDAYGARLAAERLATKLADRKCLDCGTAMPQSTRSDAAFCSARCNERAHARSRKYAVRLGLLKRQGDLILLGTIGQDHGWRCGICGRKVDRTKHHPDPLAPSIDHILPLARGGTNDLANLQLAHLRCNLHKRGEGTDQLRLV